MNTRNVGPLGRVGGQVSSSIPQGPEIDTPYEPTAVDVAVSRLSQERLDQSGPQQDVSVHANDDPKSQAPVRASFRAYKLRSVAGQSIQAIPANPSRKYLMVQNETGATITLAFGTAADPLDFSAPAGAVAEWNQVVPTNSLNVFTTVAGPFTVIEG